MADDVATLLVEDLDGAFEFARRIIRSDLPPDNAFLEGLKRALSAFSSESREGTDEWGRLVAALMIAREWAPNEFASSAARFLASPDVSVSTAALRLLLEVSQVDQVTLATIASSAVESRHDCAELLSRLSKCVGPRLN